MAQPSEKDAPFSAAVVRAAHMVSYKPKASGLTRPGPIRDIYSSNGNEAVTSLNKR